MSALADRLEVCVSSVITLKTGMVSSAVVSAYVAVCTLGRAFLRQQEETLTLLGLFLGLDALDRFFCLASGEQISVIWNGAISFRWSFNGWLVRRRDLSPGDHLWLPWRRPMSSHALTQADLELLGVSEEEVSDAEALPAESTAAPSGEGTEGWEILSQISVAVSSQESPSGA